MKIFASAGNDTAQDQQFFKKKSVVPPYVGESGVNLYKIVSV